MDKVYGANLDEKSQQLLRCFHNLSAFEQKSTLWLLQNFELVKEFAQKQEFTERKLKQLIADAEIRQDYIALELLSYAKMQNQKKTQQPDMV